MKALRTWALGMLTMSVAFGFARVFAGWSFLGPLLVVTICAHALSVATRRLRHGLATLVMFLAGCIVVVVASHWEAQRLSAFSPHVFSDLWRSLRAASDVLFHGSAPAPPTSGLLLIAAAALWIAAWSSDRLAFRYRTPVEAIAPATTVFVVVTLLAGPRFRMLSTALFALCVCGYLLAQRYSHHPKTRWRSFAAASTLCTFALGAGLGLVAAVPALSANGIIPIRSKLRDGPPRSVISPLVDIRSRLIEQSNIEMFTVQATQAQYWRLMTLDHFDGTVWSANESYRAAGSKLSAGPVDHAPNETTLRAHYHITGLTGPWAPAAYRPVSLRSTDALLWDSLGSSLIVRASVGSVTGLNYQVTSQIPTIRRTDLAHVTSTSPRAEDLELPSNFPSDLKLLAQQITAHATTRYTKALALQAYFRDNPHFTYSTAIEAGESTDAMHAFLQSGQGFCEQFAGTYAALSRAIGIPTRVAVGFTSGQQHGQTFAVYGRNAHAWPEVYFPGAGWLAFEPTPGRGNPSAVSYTNIVPQQAGPNGSITQSPTPSSGTTTPQQTPPTTVGSHPLPTIQPAPSTHAAHQKGSRPSSHSWHLVPILVLVVLAFLVLVLGPGTRTLVRRRKRARLRTHAQRITDAWSEVVESFRPLHVSRFVTDTDRDFGERLGERLQNLTQDRHIVRDAHRLSELATGAAWYAQGVSDFDAIEAETLSQSLQQIAKDLQGFWTKCAHWLRPSYGSRKRSRRRS